MRAIWSNAVIAESDSYETVEGNVYFPPKALKREFLRPSTHRSQCFWKGTAHYYDIVVDEKVNKNAAWYYPDPSQGAANIADFVAFWRGVKVEK